MPLTGLQFRPGINRETTSYTNEGGWQDCDKVRFRAGFPETIGGWEPYTGTPVLGVCRNLHTWTTLSNENFVAVGTHLKHYLASGGALFDITPIRESTADGAVTVSATDGSTTLTVSDTAHGALLGDFVTFRNAVSLGGTVTAAVLNAEHQITQIVDADTYEVELAVAANASDTGNGGALMAADYQVNTGLSDAAFGDGWGAGPWGDGGWGSPADTSVPGAQLRLWAADNYGEDLLFCVRNGGIYYWDASSGTAARGVAISDLPGANLAPTVARVVLTSDRDRHALAFGCDDELSPGQQDPLLIRFSNQESVTDWETRADNTAGSLRISSGSGIVTAVKTRQQVVVFTDVSLHALQYIGPPFTFGLTEISVNVTIAGPQAAAAVNDLVFWMGEGDFFVYDGRVRKLPCSVKEYVFNRLDISQSQKITAAHNPEFSEVWWFYQSSEGSENDSYVVYNYEQNLWYYGTLSRTAWQQRGIFGYSIGAAPDGYLYYHEIGIRDGSTSPAQALNAYIESSPVNIGEGDQFMFADRIIPDITFRNSPGSPTVTMTLRARNYPGDGYLTKEEDNPVTRTATLPVEKFTRDIDVRLRGRAVSLRVESDDRDTSWRLGTPRLRVRTDGRR
jgi:hypothetical protein